MKITDFLSMDDVFLLDNVKNKFEIYEKVFPKFIEIENNTKIERNILINKIEARGNECSFVIKEGFAIPHARFEKIEKPILKFCFVKNGVEFEKGKICHIIFIFITPSKEPATHLQIMAKTLNLFKKEDITIMINSASNSKEIFDLIAKEEKTGTIGFSSISKESIFGELETSINGLSTDESLKRIKETGKNVLKKKKETSQIIKFLKNMLSLFAILLWVGGGLCFIPGVDMPQLGWAIFMVIIINAIFSFWQEYKAEKAVEALQKMIPNKSVVLRDGEKKEIDSSELVYGDIIFFEEGDIVTADARMIETFDMKVNNSMLTGESRAIYKTAESISTDSYFLWTELPNMVFAGTSVSAGSGKAVVVGTGMTTEVGKIASITQSLKKDLSPLQKEMKRAVNTITIISISLGILFFFLGKALGGLSYIGAFIFTIGITVANIPEGLLPTLSLALAMGVTRMAKRNVLIKELSSVETLGSASVICTDKTGTLTTNKINVCKLFINNQIFNISGENYNPLGNFTNEKGEIIDKKSLISQEIFKTFFNVAVLCNNSTLISPKSDKDNWNISGDPTEAALLVLAVKLGIDISTLKNSNKRTYHFPFESIRKMMSTESESETGNKFIFTKGAPLETVDKCKFIAENDRIRELTPNDKENIKNLNDKFASEGLRVLAFAYKKLDTGQESITEKEEAEKDLIFVGITGMIDPHRAEVPAAVKECKKAGIKIFMITGDYGLTARAIAYNIGLIDKLDNCNIVNGMELSAMEDSQLKKFLASDKPVIFSRMEPIQKMRIATCAKEMGEVVAVTGDGVNDAIALKSADIGIAMGNDASAAAKEAASMIVLDGNFASIVYAIEEGRAVYANIRRFVTYIFSSNVPELIPFILFVMLKIPLPLTVMQILAIDLGTDLIPALALGVEKAEPGIMNKPPRKRTEKLIDSKLFLRSYLFLGIIETTLCMIAYYFAYFTNGWKFGTPMPNSGYVYMLATTMSLAGIVASQIGNIHCCRTDRKSVFQVGLFSNKLASIGILSEILLIFVFIYTPFFQKIFGLVPLRVIDWLLLITFPIIIISIEELRKLFMRKHNIQ